MFVGHTFVGVEDPVDVENSRIGGGVCPHERIQSHHGGSGDVEEKEAREDDDRSVCGNTSVTGASSSIVTTPLDATEAIIRCRAAQAAIRGLP